MFYENDLAGAGFVTHQGRDGYKMKNVVICVLCIMSKIIINIIVSHIFFIVTTYFIL